MTGNEARQIFLDYFKNKMHKVVNSSSLVPKDDRTLLFTNAGMVPFKRIFLGEEKKDYVRATTSQKCVRAGGKHNDLENVGHTARHHTFFEMLGNFSFGDYFKESAIEFAWDLLINGYKLPQDKLWISVYKDDSEAFEIWNNKIGVSSDRIVRLGEKDNFWSMGDTGPCGPCSEILIDRGEKFSCNKPDCKAGCDCDRYLEIWNLVFMQYNKDEKGKMTPLPKPSIDTGMGLERIVSVCQGTDTNYETDLFMPVMNTISELSEKKLGVNNKWDVSMKVIADHSRASAFLIGDGVMPSNESRGYVLRRIMRRAIRYGRNIGLEKPFLEETAKTVFKIMENAYPELKESQSFILNVIANEEKKFLETLDNGLKILNDKLLELKSSNNKTLRGDLIFKLYDTYGFPVDIVKDIARDDGFNIDMEGFEKSMENQRNKSRSQTSFSKISEAYKSLTKDARLSKFIGYKETQCKSNILLIVKDGIEVNAANKGDNVEIVTEKTPFYGESGGQLGDIGVIKLNDNFIKVTNTIKDPAGLIIHIGIIESGSFQKGDLVDLIVDKEYRSNTALNHTSTHILHAVLREVLGDHVKQSGSMVSSDRLRFDFTHYSQVTRDEILEIEKRVNDFIRENNNVITNEMSMDQASKSGATALFEEKYGETVRVVSIGSYSKELCGGTHTNMTGNIGLFRIISEASVAAGIRRIEAVTANQAVKYSQDTKMKLDNICLTFREQPEKIEQRLEKQLSYQKLLEKEINQLKSKIANISIDKSGDETRKVSGISVIAKKVEIDNPSGLREMTDTLKDRLKSGIVVLGACVNDKVLLTVGVTKDLVKKYHAGKIIKQVAEIVGGGGGGRPDMAQAGGTKVDKLDDAIEKVYEIVEKQS